MIIVKKYWKLILLGISITAIVIALIAENIFNILPCKMCIYQRYPYYGLIIISLIFILLKYRNNLLYYFSCEILLISGVILSLWHLGVEYNFIPGPSGCSYSVENIENQKDLKTFILENPIVACNEINWTFYGVSMVLINFVFQLAILIINSIYLIKQYALKQE